MNAYIDSSSDSSDEGDEILFPSMDSAADEFAGASHRRKRRKTGRDAKESAALGVFGSESEDERPDQRWKEKTLRAKGVGFVKSGGAQNRESDDSENEEFEEEDEDVEMTGVEQTTGLRGGLGWGANKTFQKEATASVNSPLGRGFIPSSARGPVLNFAPPADRDTPRIVRPSFTSPAPGSHQNGRGNAGSAPAINPNSFAVKMMAKMGYIEGRGLGSSGQGILNPIETKPRPQRIGLGAVKEKTRQAKDEAKREAARRGEAYVDSSEEEKRRRKQKASSVGTGSETSTPGGRAKPKKKYRTGAEIEAAADGLEVPNVLKSIIDLTGKESRLLTSASGLLTPGGTGVAAEPESLKIAKRACRDLEAFVDEWNGLGERKKYIEHQETLVGQEISDQQGEIQKLKDLVDVVQRLSNLNLDQPGISSSEQQWETAVGLLETLQVEFSDKIENYGLSEITVAAIHPLFRTAMEDWEPLENHSYLVTYIHRLRKILKVISEPDSKALMLPNGHRSVSRSSKSTTHYETMIYTLWLPKVRSVINNSWDVHDPTPAISLIEAWKDLLPPFIHANVMNQLIVQKLTTAVSEWNPRSSSRKHHHHHRRHNLPPHIWLFPWLQYLDAHHIDPKSPTGLLADVKRKFRTLIDTWDLNAGLLPGLKNWKEVLRTDLDNILIRHLLPRLAVLLAADFTVNPADQDLRLLEQVLLWTEFFKPSVMAQLLIAEFFPKWHAILHLWLTSDPNYEEVGEWFSWWKARIPDEINGVPAVAEEWAKGLETINYALDLGERAKTDLPPPAAGPAKPIKEPKAPTTTTTKKAAAADAAATTFRDVLEAWCSDENLLLIPLREAHAVNGLPLFRITASANGRGGVVCYLKGDVVWCQSRKDKGTWEPVGLGSGLVERAEGR